MTLSQRLAALFEASRSSDTTVSWSALRILGLLSERHFLPVVDALMHHCDENCEELRQLERTLNELERDTPGH